MSQISDQLYTCLPTPKSWGDIKHMGNNNMMLLHPKYIKQPPTLKNSKKQEEKILTNKPKKNPITMKLQAMS